MIDVIFYCILSFIFIISLAITVYLAYDTT